MRSKRLATSYVIGLLGLGLVSGCPGTPQSGGCAGVNGTCTSDTACCEGLECVDGACIANTQAAIPAKTIGLELVGIHDPDSDAYNENCIGCHGDRIDEVALDGVTPAAHATMLTSFSGEENARCTACHGSGPDFLTLSAGGLREQVNMQQVGCSDCHGAQSTIGPPLYAHAGS